jgi:hypothetical protein
VTNLTLLVKAAHSVQIRQIEEMLTTQFEELDAEVKLLGNSLNKWVQVSVSGEDETIAAAYINREFGTCPMTLEAAKALPALKGYISKVDLTKGELRVDVGIFEPKPVQAVIPLANLRTQMAEGKEVNLKVITENYGLAEGVPVTVKPQGADAGEGEVFQTEFSEEQVEKLHSWQMSLLDRLIVLGASKESVDDVLERTHLGRDVIDVEKLGFFEYSLTCKLGTDAAGLIPRMGRYMRYSVFVVFNAKKGAVF